MQPNPMQTVDVFLAAAECAALGLNIPQAWKHLLDSETVDALDLIREANQDGYNINTVVLGQSTLVVQTEPVLRPEKV